MNLKKSIEYFKKASEKGHVESAYNLACIYRDDDNVNYLLNY